MTHATPPPVMARGYNMEVPFQAKRATNKKTRRRVDVPLNVPGAEMRLPSLPMVRVSFRWVALLLGLVFLGALYYLWHAPFFRVEAAQIEGANRVKKSDINAILTASNKPVFALHPAEMEKNLLAAFPEFSSVVIKVSLPNSMLVNVVERVPVLTWRQGDEARLIDEAGFAFPMRLEASSPITSLVEAAGSPPSLGVSPQDIAALVANDLQQAGTQAGKQAGTQAGTNQDKGNGQTSSVDRGLASQTTSLQPFLKPEMVSAILAMSKVVPANVTLIYDANHGLGWQDERGWQVYLGDAQDMEMKLRVYDALVQRLLSEEVQPALISVEHVHNPYYRLAQ
jgi:cell division septal protein FtsQ